MRNGGKLVRLRVRRDHARERRSQGVPEAPLFAIVVRRNGRAHEVRRRVARHKHPELLRNVMLHNGRASKVERDADRQLVVLEHKRVRDGAVPPGVKRPRNAGRKAKNTAKTGRLEVA